MTSPVTFWHGEDFVQAREGGKAGAGAWGLLITGDVSSAIPYKGATPTMTVETSNAERMSRCLMNSSEFLLNSCNSVHTVQLDTRPLNQCPRATRVVHSTPGHVGPLLASPPAQAFHYAQTSLNAPRLHTSICLGRRRGLYFAFLNGPHTVSRSPWPNTLCWSSMTIRSF